jgi:hypothetical protein
MAAAWRHGPGRACGAAAVLALLGLLAAGCGGQSGYMSHGAPAGAEPAVAAQEATAPVELGVPMGGADAGRAAPASMQVAEQQSNGVRGKATAPPGMPRKIIYTANVSLTTEDLAALERTLVKTARDVGGFVASSNVAGASGAPRQGTWTFRVPSARFAEFVESISRAAELRQVTTDSSDVSEEFYDARSRLRNKRVQEERLIAHMQRSTARLQDILALEQELSRVREEIERIEGRLRFLADQADLSTVTVTADELRGFVPERRAGLGEQIGRTFAASAGALGDTGRGLLLLVVAAVPWLAAFVVLATPLAWWLWRLLHRPAPPQASP